MKNTYYITLPVDSSNRKPREIQQKQWNGFIDDVRKLIHQDVTPHDLVLHGHKHGGSPLVDSNAISISPEQEKGNDLVIKRNGTKVLMRVKTNDSAYATVIGAILLALKRRVKDVIISNKLHLKGMQKAIAYYHYVLESPAPNIHPSMASEVIISFKWMDNLGPEDAEQAIEDIKALLGDNAYDINVRFKS